MLFRSLCQARTTQQHRAWGTNLLLGPGAEEGRWHPRAAADTSRSALPHLGSWLHPPIPFCQALSPGPFPSGPPPSNLGVAYPEHRAALPCQPVADVHLLRAGIPKAPGQAFMFTLSSAQVGSRHCRNRAHAHVAAGPPRGLLSHPGQGWDSEGLGQRGLSWAAGFGARAPADHAGTWRESWGLWPWTLSMR